MVSFLRIKRTICFQLIKLVTLGGRLKLWFCIKQFVGSRDATSPELSMLKFLSKTSEKSHFILVLLITRYY